jgi:hypothetical protein
MSIIDAVVLVRTHLHLFHFVTAKKYTKRNTKTDVDNFFKKGVKQGL